MLHVNLIGCGSSGLLIYTFADKNCELESIEIVGTSVCLNRRRRFRCRSMRSRNVTPVLWLARLFFLGPPAGLVHKEDSQNRKRDLYNEQEENNIVGGFSSCPWNFVALQGSRRGSGSFAALIGARTITIAWNC